MDKQIRKQNIVIKGHDFKENEELEDATNFIANQLNLNVKIKDVQKIRTSQGKPPVAIVKVDTMKDKELIMKNKSKLRGTRYFIENDLTQAEAKLQKELRDMAREEIGKGNETKVGYQKICINDEWWKWNHSTEKLEKMKKKLSPHRQSGQENMETNKAQNRMMIGNGML
ncbi:uncharacterized protein [Diabrotica undecimpunctata]|uniref:uncharacterized protein n=1 Tax=Diabrotica undecimpunctata TaxID=50387 RepID=UPI003B6369F3